MNAVKKWKMYLRGLLLGFFLLLCAIGVYHVYKPLPAGLDFQGELRPAWDVEFLADLTYVDGAGQRHTEQAIFDEVFSLIEAADRFILLDMFLFNAFQGDVKNTHRELSRALTERLLRQQQRHPRMQIIVITDPVNTVYGGMGAPHLEALTEAGIAVVYTQLPALRDSNPVYSALWRTLFAHWGNEPADTLANPFGEGRVSLRSYLRLLNFKANHRKLIVVNEGQAFTGLVTSANPHDGSSAHGNVALKFRGAAVGDLLATEQAVLNFSADAAPRVPTPEPVTEQKSPAGIQILTEQAIEQTLLTMLDTAEVGDQLDMAVFYLSDRHVMEALLSAHQRGVTLRVILDPNKDAFGREKNGIPNRQTGGELHRAGVPVRWCDTHGEQCHAKFIMARYQSGKQQLLLGSANFTRRNLDNYNLETNVLLTGPAELPALIAAAEWFDRRWNNRDDQYFTVSYPDYADDSVLRRLLYRFMEFSGMSTF